MQPCKGYKNHQIYEILHSCLIIRLAYLGLFSVTDASISEVSKKSIEESLLSMSWHISSVISTRLSKTNCKSSKKFCLESVILDA